MKIRTDFVTNSSSSSFIIITTKENYDEVCKNVTPYVQAVAKAMFRSQTVLGKECMVADCYDSNGFTSFEYMSIDYDGEDTEDGPQEAFDTLCHELSKNKDAVFHHRTKI